jgi:hypothetical protein
MAFDFEHVLESFLGGVVVLVVAVYSEGCEC